MHEPSALVWDLLLLLTVILFGPFVAERLRLPGIIGLLLGGFLIGPTGLGLLRSVVTVDSLGQIGLLYLMFLAGLELDLNVFARLRRAAIQFGLLTFALPMAFGFVGARWLGFDLPASILIGSLWASHTLVMYPIMQRFGIQADPAVATTVGATVITDTLALLVLAVVASGATGEGGLGSNLALLVGLGVLAVYCAFVLTFLTRWFFAGLGQDRALRFIFVLAAFLSASFVAELGGIEGIVGAFFAGLALNRLVPNGGPLMDRVEFFGGALFIPAFLVSVGLLIDPTVLADPRTWQLAIVFAVSLVLGKGGAALAIGRIRRFSRRQVEVVFSLSLSQAAATLAATTVGASVGLFGDDVVNAVVVVIVFSLFTSSVLATRAAARIAPPARDGRPLGAAIVAAIEDGATALRLAPVLARIAQRDGGIVVPAHVIADGEDRPLDAAPRDRARDRRGGQAGGHRGRPEPARRAVRAAGRPQRDPRARRLAARHRAPRRDPRAGLPVRRPVRGDRRGVAGPGHGRGDGRDAGAGACSCRCGPTTCARAAARRPGSPWRSRAGSPRRGWSSSSAGRTAPSCRTRCRSPRTPGSSRWRPTATAGSGRRRRPATSCCSPAPGPRSCSGGTPPGSPRWPAYRSASSSGRSPSTGFPVTSPVGSIVAGNTAPI